MSKIVKFYSDSCSPCVAMAPIFEEVIKDLGLENVESKNIGEDGVRDEALKAGVRSVPSFVVYLDNGNILSQSGTLSKEALTTFLKDATSL